MAVCVSVIVNNSSKIFKSFILGKRLNLALTLQQSYYHDSTNFKSTSKMGIEIDLRSDTVTKPTPAMREAMATAVVGDDVFEDDPTVIALQEKSAAMLGMEAALFVPSGTMSNLIAALVHCHRRGSEMITGDLSHMFLYEQGGAAQFGGIQINTVPNRPDGTFCFDEMKKRIRTRDLHEPFTSLVCVENTHAKCGGKVLPLTWLQDLVSTCKGLNLPLHMDGARLYNSAIQSGVPAKKIVEGFTSVSLCLSKGLGAPVGSLLHGTKDFIHRAKRVRKALGGGMRQSGILAAAGIVALDSMVLRLADDHNNAIKLAKGIADLKHPSFKIDVDGVHTNIFIFEIIPSKINNKEFCQKLLEVTKEESSKLGGESISIKAIAFETRYVRMVLHNQITPEMVQLALKKIALVVQECC